MSAIPEETDDGEEERPKKWDQRTNKDGTMKRATIRVYPDGLATLKFDIDDQSLFRKALGIAKGLTSMTFNEANRWQQFTGNDAMRVAKYMADLLGPENVLVDLPEGLQMVPVARAEPEPKQPRLPDPPAMSTADAYTALCLLGCVGPQTIKAAYHEAMSNTTDPDVIQRLGVAISLLQPKIKGRLRKP